MNADSRSGRMGPGIEITAEGGAVMDTNKIGLKPYSPIQMFFMMRLSYLHRQRRECINVLEGTDWRMRLLNKALYSTFRDCDSAGVVYEAKLLMEFQKQIERAPT